MDGAPIAQSSLTLSRLLKVESKQCQDTAPNEVHDAEKAITGESPSYVLFGMQVRLG